MSHWVSALVVVLIGVGLRLINLTAGGLWLDEIWSMKTSASHQTVSGIIAACVQDTHPPLFDLLLHGWLVLFGDSDLSGRSLALLFGVAGMVLTWIYALKITANKALAFVALAVVAFNYFHIYYSNEVRFYGFIYVLAVIILGHFYLFLRNAKYAHLAWPSLAMLALLYTHYYGVFLMAGLGVSCVLLLVQRQMSRASFWRVFFAMVAVVLAYTPWIPVMLQGGHSASWMQPPAWYHFFEYFYAYTGKNPVSCALILGLFLVGLRYVSRYPVLLTLLYSVTFMGFLLPFLASHAVVPMLHERYTMIYFPAIVWIVALVFVELPKINWTGRGVVLLVMWVSIAVNLGFVHSFFQEREKEPWRAIAQELREENHNLQAPVYTEMHFWLNYYLAQFELTHATTNPDQEPANLFWAVVTPYDSDPFMHQDKPGYEVLRQSEFRNGFSLLLVQRPN